ncbi:MAG: hypothetical protein ACAH88_11960 [Roseimicrobium sp.]
MMFISCRRSLLTFASLLCASVLSLQAADRKEPEAPSFTGSWIFQTKTSGFGVDLVQTGDKIEGYHNSVVDGGRRVDTVLKEFDSPPSITGTVVNGVATVKFKSGYGDGAGEAVMKIVKGQLDWTITSSEGQHFFPDKCVMQREKKKEKAKTDKK